MQTMTQKPNLAEDCKPIFESIRTRVRSIEQVIHSRHQRRMGKTQKFFKCAHGKSAHYVHVASTNAQSHNRRTRPTRTAQQPINRPHYVGGAPRAQRGRTVMGDLRVNPQTSTCSQAKLKVYWHKSPKYTSNKPSL